jgi:hypothetical protein
MGWFRDFFRKKSQKYGKNYDFTDEDRDVSAELRRQKAELSKLKMEKDAELYKLKIEREKLALLDEIDDLKAAMNETDDYADGTGGGSDIDKLLLGILAPILLKSKEVTTPPQKAPAATPSNITIEQLREIWENLPGKTRSIARNVSDDTLKAYIRAQMPALDEETINKAVVVVREN